MNVSSRFLSAFALMSLIIGATPIAPARAAETTAEAFDLIRGTTFSSVYYMAPDGLRYVFPNEKTYFTWYADFSTVKTISDAELADIQMGGNVTYRPGSKMVKIDSDPKTYMVTQGGTLRWVPSEEMADALYGSSWQSKIDDIPDGFFGNYVIGDVLDDVPLKDATIFVANTLEDTAGIDQNFAWTMRAPISVSISSLGLSGIFGGSFEIYEGNTVRFRNEDSAPHAATADDKSWGTGTLQPGESFVHRFETVGDSSYYDSYNPGVRAIITVIEE